MMKVNVTKLMEAISEAEDYRAIEEGRAGLSYLYDSLYNPISNGEPVRLHDLDYDRFRLENVSELEDYYDTNSLNQWKASNISRELRSLQPAALKVDFL